MEHWYLKKYLKLLIATATPLILLTYSCFILLAPVKVYYTLVVPAGTTANSVAISLTNNNVYKQPQIFKILTYIMQATKKLQAGEYQITPTDNVISIINKIKLGKDIQYKVTLIEGLRYEQILKIIQSHPKITKTLEPTKDLQLKFTQKLNSNEGLFLADTYAFSAGTKDSAILQRAHNTLIQELMNSWHTASNETTCETPYEILILASIIEKETNLLKEYPLVSGVYQHRLTKNMRLQADPTVIYAHFLRDGFFNRLLTRQDLKLISPYNTYRNKGLPPTPIAIVNKHAIYAACNPEINGSLYFVANGRGGHIFSNTLTEHIKAINTAS